MIEIELFYKIVESEIRRKHVKYLKKQKCLPSDNSASETQSPDEKSMVSITADIDDFAYTDKPSLKEKAKRVKAFNKGIETALKALQDEYKRFEKLLETEE